MIRVLSLTDPSVVISCGDYATARATALKRGHIVAESVHTITYSDFPRHNPTSHPIEIAPIPLHLLRDTKG